MFLDIAFGLFLGKFFSVNYFNNDLTIIYLGVIFALLPDIVFVTNYFYDKTRNKYLKIFAHRGIFHTPIFYLTIATILFFLDTDKFIVLIFLIGTIYHLVHDLFVLGRGVMILYPYSKIRLKIFPDDGKDGYLKQKVLWWNEQDTPKYDLTESQTLHNEGWIKTWYFRPNLFLGFEIIFTLFFLFLFFITS